MAKYVSHQLSIYLRQPSLHFGQFRQLRIYFYKYANIMIMIIGIRKGN